MHQRFNPKYLLLELFPCVWDVLVHIQHHHYENAPPPPPGLLIYGHKLKYQMLEHWHFLSWLPLGDNLILIHSRSTQVHIIALI